MRTQGRVQGFKEILVDRDPSHGGVGLVRITPEMTPHMLMRDLGFDPWVFEVIVVSPQGARVLDPDVAIFEDMGPKRFLSIAPIIDCTRDV